MKTQVILAAVLSLATVSAMADSHHKSPKHHRGDRVTVINHHYHNNHRVAPPRYAPPPRHVRHQRPAPRYVEHRPVLLAPPAPPAPRVIYAPVPRPVPVVPRVSLSVNL